MSADPRTGVVDELCRVHFLDKLYIDKLYIDKLYIAGSSVFTTRRPRKSPSRCSR
jgi:hypothetical protein